MQILPWEYLFKAFTQFNVPDLHGPLTWASLLWLIGAVAVYNIRSRQLRRHAVYVQMYEWLMWTAVITASLMLVYWIFHFDMILVMGTLIGGLAVTIWVRYRRFPPEFAAYERQLAKQRYFTRDRFAHPETTLRSKTSRRRRRRR